MEKKQQQPDKICVQENDNREGRRSIECVRGKKKGGGGARNMHVCGGRRVTMSFGERGVSVFFCFFYVFFILFIYLFILFFFFFFFFWGGGGGGGVCGVCEGIDLSFVMACK